jgi:hypothetical protein
MARCSGRRATVAVAGAEPALANREGTTQTAAIMPPNFAKKDWREPAELTVCLRFKVGPKKRNHYPNVKQNFLPNTPEINY